MSIIKRRHFLQGTGAMLATLGLSQLEIQQQGLRYAKAIAQSTPRKLALLVGINDYPTPINPLRGCINDVLSQRELLVHRFGFNPSDILILKDAQATRKGILQAFEEHLIKQAKPGDVVVFHYSGHGSQVSDEPDCDSKAAGLKECVNSTIVPYDSFGSAAASAGGIVNDITGHTLFLLMSAVQTENMTVLLDSCHSGGGTRGNFLIRSVERMGGGTQFKPTPEEKAYQQQWLSRLNLSPKAYIDQRRAGIAKGVIVAAARRDQYAADVPFGGFSAGAFSYTMTRYLWQQAGSEPVSSAIDRIALSAKTQAATSGITQDPLVEFKPSSQNNQRPFFFLEPGTPPAEAIVTQVSGKQVTCWLGGVDPETLEAFGKGTLFTIIDRQSKKQGRVKLTDRNGLVAKGEILEGSAQPGALLQEEVRGIPTDLPLEVILDASLGNDVAAAEQAIKQLKRVKAVSAGQSGQYLLARLTDAYLKGLKSKPAKLPPIGSVGLMSPGRDQLVEDSFGVANEPINSAITRLRSKFTLLLAGRLLQMLKNPSSSQVAVKVGVTATPSGARASQPVAEVGTLRSRSAGGSTSSSRTISSATVQQVKDGSKIKIQVTNGEVQNLYFAVLGIASSGEMIVLFPTDWSAPADAALVKSQQTIEVPNAGDGFSFTVEGADGDVVEVLVLASASSLRNALKGLQRIAASRGTTRGALPLGEEATSAMDELLGGLDENTRGSFKVEIDGSKRAIAANQLAAISVPLQIVKKTGS